jgi:hypothetical protein
MRDVDVVCASAAGSLRFVVEDGNEHLRPRESVLQIKPLAGPEAEVPVRVHRTAEGFSKSSRDVVGPWHSSKVVSEGTPVCLELSLAVNPWAPTPTPEIAPASETEYVVHAEAL